MDTIRIIGARITNRLKDVGEVQDILTRYGCAIKTRLGLHEADESGDSQGGLLILELTGDLAEMDNFESALEQVEGVIVRRMDFPK